MAIARHPLTLEPDLRDSSFRENGGFSAIAGQLAQKRKTSASSVSINPSSWLSSSGIQSKPIFPP